MQVPQLQAPVTPAMRSQSFVPLIYGEPTCVLHRSPYRGRLRLSDPQFSNLHLWLEATYLPYAGYDHILSKQTGESRARSIQDLSEK